jgi:small subunit ribosomal protein S17
MEKENHNQNQNQLHPQQAPKQPEERKKGELILFGEVVSTKADKTISVSVERIFQHPVYKKIMQKKKRYMVHDEHNRCKPGDTVHIKLVRPISKRKHWLLLDVVSSAPEKEKEIESSDINEVTP